MKKLISKLFEPPEPKMETVDTSLLLSHLEAIGVNLLEIHNLKKKRVGDKLVQNIWREVDLEKAWPSSGHLLFETYRAFCNLSLELHITPEGLKGTYSFRQTIKVFLRQIDQMIDHLTSTREVPLFNRNELKIFDRKVLLIQNSINRLHKHVLVDFDFFSPPQAPRPEAPKNDPPPQGPRKLFSELTLS